MQLQNKDIIEKWDKGEDINWRLLTILEKREWLLACLFKTGLPTATLGRKNYVVDGNQINDSVDLYCQLGEIFIGDKGYLGQDLDGLHDCLIDVKVTPGTVLTIKNHKKLTDVLNKRSNNYFTMFTDIFKEHGITLRLE